MPRSRTRRPQEEERMRLVRSCHDELVKIQEAIDRSTQISSTSSAQLLNAIAESAQENKNLTRQIVLLTYAFLLIGGLTVYATIVNALTNPNVAMQLLITLMVIDLSTIGILIWVFLKIRKV